METFEDCQVGPDYDDAPTPDTFTSQTQFEAQVSRTKRSKQNPKNDALEVLKIGLQDIAKAISDLLDKPSISSSELWQLISSLGLEGNMKTKAYMLLLKDRDLLHGFISIPPEERMEFLLAIMFGGN